MTRFAAVVTVLPLLLVLANRTFGSHGCGKVQKADVVLLVDESKSISGADWTKQLDFLSQLVGKLEVGKDKVNVAVICFDNRVRKVTDSFTTHTTTSALQGVIKGLVQKRGMTSTWDGIAAAGEMFEKARKGVPKILIVVTDGQPNGYATGVKKTTDAATKVKATGVTAVAVGVGMSQYDVVLKNIASAEKYVANVNKMSELLQGGFLDLVVQNIECAVEEVPRAQPRALCKKVTKADIVFIVDESGSIAKKDFEQDVTKFMSIMVNQLPIGKDQVHASVYKFASMVDKPPVATLGQFSKQELKTKVESMKQKGGQTMTNFALEAAKKELQLRGRKGVQRLVILLTDGASTHPPQTHKTAQALKALNPPPIVMSIGVGNKTNDAELKAIATDVSYVKHVGNTLQLADEGFIQNELVATLNCAVAEPMMCG